MSWFKKNKQKKVNYFSQNLNRYQIQVYNDNGIMIHCNIHEGFTFKDACDEALIEVKTKVDIKTIITPLKFHCSTYLDK